MPCYAVGLLLFVRLLIAGDAPCVVRCVQAMNALRIYTGEAITTMTRGKKGTEPQYLR